MRQVGLIKAAEFTSVLVLVTFTSMCFALFASFEPAASATAKRAVDSEPAMESPEKYPQVSLANTYWKLTVVDTEPVIMAESQQREAYLQLREDTNTLRGFAGCNNFSGGYEVVASQLSLQYLARTRKACPEVMSAEVKFLSALDRTVSFAIVGEVLTLIDEAGAPAAEFLAVYF